MTLTYQGKLFAEYPDVVSVKSIFIKPHYYISKNSVIEYVLSEDYAKRKVRDHV